MITRRDFLVRLARHEPQPVPRAFAVNGRYETKKRRNDDDDEEEEEDGGSRHALATGRNLPRSDRDYRARETRKLREKSLGTVFIIRRLGERRDRGKGGKTSSQ